MNKKLLLLGSALAFLASCQNGNKQNDNNSGDDKTTAATENQCWPKVDAEGNYVMQEGDPIFLVSDKFRKQFIHPTQQNDSISNSNEYNKFLWKDFVLKIASGEFVSGANANMYVPENFETMRGPLFVPIDQEETVKLSKQMNTQWFDLMPVAFTEKSMASRQVLSFTDKKSWNDIRKMEDSLQAKVVEKYGLEIEHSEWLANINNNSVNLYQVQFKAKDNKVTASVIAFKEDGSFFSNDESIELVDGKANWNVDDDDNIKNAPSIACVLESENKSIEIYYIERAPESISTGVYVLCADKLNKVSMNDWYVKQ
ncbi:MAG: hypothetical protein MJZ33_00845 [Paludibacteraceae bacterium]|nr:hypothetical protein [Paludibacteraceae bacterium]